MSDRKKTSFLQDLGGLQYCKSSWLGSLFSVLSIFLFLFVFTSTGMAAITWSSELLTNGDFETGNATGWSNGGGGSVTIGYQCAACDDGPHGGSYQAYWQQPSNSAYYLYQNVNITSYAGDIDAGNAVVTATGWLISNEYPSQDLFYMQVRFYDGADPATSNEITGDRYDTGTMDVATWAQYGLTAYTIPTGARSLQVRFNTWEPTWDAGSADDFSVKVGIASSECGVIARVGSWTTGLSHTVGAGSDRLLVFVTGYEHSANVSINSVTYGGQTMTQAEQHFAGTSTYARVEIWYLNEAGILAASGTTFVVTYSATPTYPMHAAATFENVDQITPLQDTDKAYTNAATPNPIVTPAFDVVAGGMAVAGATSGNNGSYTWNNSWTEGTDQAVGSTTTMSTGEHAATAVGTDTASATHSGPNRQVIVAASLNPNTASCIDSDGNLSAAATVSEPVAISSIADTVGERVAVFDFSISDGGTADGLSLDVSQIVLNTSGTGTFDDITWQLYGPDADYVTGTVAAGTITFSSLNVSVADGASEVYTVYAYFSSSPTSTDGQTFILSVDGDTDLTVSGSGTQMGTTSAVDNGTGSTMDVVHSQLIYSTQPPSTATIDTDFSGTVAVSATDANNNVDIDFNEAITISAVITVTHAAANGTLTSTDTGGTTKTPTGGVATWTDTKYDYAETIDLKAVSATTYTSGIYSNAVTVTAQTETGWKSGNCVSVNRVTGGYWSNPQYAESSDNNRAIADMNPNSTSDWLQCTNFGFTTADIPSGATIDGIEVQIERQGELGDVDDSAIYLRDGAQTGDNKASLTNWGTTDSTATYGGASDDWNALLSDSDIRDTSFGIDISADNDNNFQNREARIDNVQIKVYYSVASADSDGNLSAAATVSEPVAISSVADTVGERVAVFDFTLSDGGTSDGLPLDVSQIVLNTSGTGTFGDVTWQLYGPDADYVTGTVAAGTITFGSLSVSVADGASEDYTVYAYFSSSPTSTDGQTFILSVDGDTDLTVSGSGTQMGTTSAVENGTGSTMNVVHSQLIFSTQPPSTATIDTDFSGTVAVSAADANNNVDIDFSENITISAVITVTHAAANGTLTSMDSGGTTKTPTSGVAAWTDTKYDYAETIDIRAVSATTYTTGIYSNAVAVTIGGKFLYRKSITIDKDQVGSSCTGTTATWQVAANNRDAWDDIGNGSLDLAYFGDTSWTDAAGYQWAVTIPPGATIISAKVRVYSASHGGATGAYTARLRVEDVDSASAFSGAANDVHNRSYWATTVDWSIPSGGLPTSAWSDSPDITALVQHIVDRTGWASGNYLNVAIWGQTSNGGGAENINDFSNSTSNAAQLEVTYQSGSGTPLNDYPILVNIASDDDLRTTANGGHVESSSGHDIVFRWDDGTCAGGTPCKGLYHELEKYDATSGEVVAWVKIPTLSVAADTVIYMYYGNSAVTSASEIPNDVWDNNYKGVWHLNETTGSFMDSTSNGNNGTLTDVDVDSTRGASGQMDGAIDLTGDADYIQTTSGESQTAANFTWEAWFKTDTTTGAHILLWQGDAAQNGWSGGDSLGDHEAHVNIGKYDANGIIGCYYGNDEDVAADTIQINTATDTADFHHVAFVVTNADTGTVSGEFFIDGTSVATDTTTQNTRNDWDTNFRIGGPGAIERYFDGIVDEVRISTVARDACWIETEYNNQNAPGTFYTLGSEEASAATAVNLVSFTAQGAAGNAVNVAWETASEVDNMGFYVYRSGSPTGSFERLNAQLISGLTFSPTGKKYSLTDTNAIRGQLYYYQLEDIDLRGKRTVHGPICVDWDADGLPDDWEIAHGLNPNLNDADLDSDGDGLSNLEEYLLGNDPHNPDSDGDGILDGADDGRIDDYERTDGRSLGRGVEMLATDETGVVLELRTTDFESTIMAYGGEEFDRLSIADYIHGYTAETGSPQMPLKGVLVDIPAGKSATLSILATDIQTHSGYQVYPVPANVGDESETTASVAEMFVIDENAYQQNAFYPQAAAGLGDSFVFRGRSKRQVVFYPLSYNPFTGQMIQFSRIRVRVNFVDDQWAQVKAPKPTPWQPPRTDSSFENLFAMDLMAGVFSLPQTFISPIIAALLSPTEATAAVWAPPQSGAADGVYKLMVSEQGIYRLTRSYLAGNGVDVDAVDLDQVRLYHLGDEVAVYVYDQGTPGSFDTDDYIDFYGQPVEAPYAKYTADNVYWLILDGGRGDPGRMAVIDGTPAGADLATTHTATVRYEENKVVWLLAPGDDDFERWFFMSTVSGAEVAGGGSPVVFNFDLADVAGDGTLTISLYGAYDTDHEVAVTVNGNDAGTFTWSGIAAHQVVIDAAPLADANSVTLQSVTGFDTIYVDAFEAVYPQYFSAVNDALKFSHQKGSRFTITDFGADTLAVYDVTDTGDLLRITDFTTTGSSSPYTLEFEPLYAADAAADRTYFALSAAGVKTPDAMVEDTASNLADTANGADYILITRRALGWDGNGDAYEWLNDLAALRQAQGLRVEAVAVEDIYDEFGYGRVGPHPIKDFLTYAYTSWTDPAPRYVVLVGDSTYDPKNHWDWFMPDTTAYIPAYLIFTDYKGETVTDEWFGCVSGDDAVADLFIGRLPAKDVADAGTMVAKILAYEQTANTKSWEKNVLLVADDQRDGQQYEYEAVFKTINEDAAALLPEGFNEPFRGYLNSYSAAGYLTTAIKTHINDADKGALILNYSGHGATQFWAEPPDNIFKNADVADLTNAATNAGYPFIISMSCEAGYFAYPQAWSAWTDPDSLAETFMSSQNGPAAAFMPTGMTTTGGQHILNAALFETFFTEDVRLLGDVIATAKQQLLANGDDYYEQITNTFMLFGDPATALKVPLPRRPAQVQADGQLNAIALQWQAAVDCNDQPVDGYNLYRATAPGGPYEKLNDAVLTTTEYLDTADSPGLGAAVAALQTGKPYYYVVKSVAVDGDESVASAEVSARAAALSSNVTGPLTNGNVGSKGCFIQTAKGANPGDWMVFGFMVAIAVALAVIRNGRRYKV